MRPGREARGVAVPELLLSAAVTLVLAASLAEAVRQAGGIFQAQPERADLHQRLRVAVDTLARDLAGAGSGVPSESSAPVLPYRVGHSRSDVEAGVYYRPDAISLVHVPWGASEPSTRTYYLREDPATGASQLMQYDGRETDLPVVDHLALLRFEYLDARGVAVAAPDLQDGPWVPDDDDPHRFDADLRRVRRVRVSLRVGAALASMRGPAGPWFARGGTSTAAERLVPDQQIAFDVAIRNAAGE